MPNTTRPGLDSSVPERNIVSRTLPVLFPALLASVTLTWWAGLTWVTGYVVGTW